MMARLGPMSWNPGPRSLAMLADAYATVENDQLYLRRGSERIKFVERALMKIAANIEEVGDGWVFFMNETRTPIGRDDTDAGSSPNGTPSP